MEDTHKDTHKDTRTKSQRFWDNALKVTFFIMITLIVFSETGLFTTLILWAIAFILVETHTDEIRKLEQKIEKLESVVSDLGDSLKSKYPRT
jgi:hypothetical protein